MVVLYQLSYIGKRARDESPLLSTASADDASLLTSAREVKKMNVFIFLHRASRMYGTPYIGENIGKIGPPRVLHPTLLPLIFQSVPCRGYLPAREAQVLPYEAYA
jgi:hypothetical protein